MVEKVGIGSISDEFLTPLHNQKKVACEVATPNDFTVESHSVKAAAVVGGT